MLWGVIRGGGREIQTHTDCIYYIHVYMYTPSYRGRRGHTLEVFLDKEMLSPDSGPGPVNLFTWGRGE